MTEQEQIEEMAHTMCLLEEENCQECAKNNYPFIAVTDCDLVRRANRLYAAGYRKTVEGYWRVVSYTDSAFYTHSILTCSVCGTKQAAITSMFPNHCYECGSRMTETVLEKVIRFEEEWKGGDI
jgi:hypothetical protein